MMKKTLCLFIFSALFLSLLFQGCGFMDSGNPQTGEQGATMSPDLDTPPASLDPPLTMPDDTCTPALDRETNSPEPSRSTEAPFSKYRETYKYFEYGETYDNPGDFSYWYYQIAGLDNPAIESMINHELKAAAIDWLVDDGRDVVSLEPDFYYGDEQGIYQVGRYLWASNWCCYPQAKRYGIFNIRVTIDLETGKRVFLDDLLKINTDFLIRIRDDDIATFPNSIEFCDPKGNYGWEGYSNPEVYNKDVRKILKEMSLEELSLFLDSCQMDNEMWRRCLENGGNYHDDLNGFYLNDGELVLFRSGLEHRVDIAFKLDDIEEFLKVPKW